MCDAVQRLSQEEPGKAVAADVAEAFGDCAVVFICGILEFSAHAKLREDRCKVRN